MRIHCRKVEIKSLQLKSVGREHTHTHTKNFDIVLQVQTLTLVIHNYIVVLPRTSVQTDGLS